MDPYGLRLTDGTFSSCLGSGVDLRRILEVRRVENQRERAEGVKKSRSKTSAQRQRQRERRLENSKSKSSSKYYRAPRPDSLISKPVNKSHFLHDMLSCYISLLSMAILVSHGKKNQISGKRNYEKLMIFPASQNKRSFAYRIVRQDAEDVSHD